MPQPQTNPHGAVPVKRILASILKPKVQESISFVISGKAAKRLHELSLHTGIEKKILAECAIDALHAALANKPQPRQVADAKLRAWLNRPKED